MVHKSYQSFISAFLLDVMRSLKLENKSEKGIENHQSSSGAKNRQKFLILPFSPFNWTRILKSSQRSDLKSNYMEVMLWETVITFGRMRKETIMKLLTFNFIEISIRKVPQLCTQCPKLHWWSRKLRREMCTQ